MRFKTRRSAFKILKSGGMARCFVYIDVAGLFFRARALFKCFVTLQATICSFFNSIGCFLGIHCPPQSWAGPGVAKARNAPS